MPRKDGTGPQGMGSKTGRGLGQCNPDNTAPSSQSPRGQNKGQGFGRGQGQGAGRGQGGGRGGGRGRGRK